MNEQENNITKTTTEPVVNTPVETPVTERATTPEVEQPPVVETPITQETPTVTIGTPEVTIPEETPKKQSNGSKIFIVIIILVLALIAGFLVFRYVKGELDDNNLANEPEEELPVEVETTTTPVSSENIDVEQTYTVSVNNKAQDFKFTFYYDTVNQEINGTTTELYEYMLEITTKNESLGRFITGRGTTKEEAKAVTVNNSRPTYNEELIKTIKDTATEKDYIVLTIPEYKETRTPDGVVEVSAFIATPVIYDANGTFINKVTTTTNLNGFSYIENDSKYGLTKDYVTANYAAAIIDNNAIIYIEEQNCSTTVITADVKKLTIENGKDKIAVIEEQVPISAEGASC